MPQAGGPTTSSNADRGVWPVDVARASDACPTPAVSTLRVDTSAPVEDREHYVAATVVLGGDDGARTLEGQIRGRGKTTWELMPKKPYLLKLDEAAAVLGMPANRKWVLLANFADKTLLRTSVALCLARMLQLPFTPSDRFVELTLNGEYLGLYQLTDKVYELRDLLEGRRADGSGADDEHESVLLEIDTRFGDGGSYGEEYGFESASGIRYAVDFDTDDAQVARVAKWMNELEGLLSSEHDTTWFDRVAERIDIPSMIDLYLVNELTRNIDAYWSSTYLYRDGGGPLRYGPVWDFDLSLGNANYNYGWDTQGWFARDREANWYLRELLREPEFVDLLQQRWGALRDRLGGVIDHIDEMVTRIEPARERNFERWPIMNVYVTPNVILGGSYDVELDYMTTFFTRRASWIDEHIGEIANI